MGRVLLGGPTAAEYRLTHGEKGISLTLRYTLEGNALGFRIAAVDDPVTPLRSLAWDDLPLVTCRGLEWRVFRDRFAYRTWDEAIGRGLAYSRYETVRAGASFPDDGRLRGIHACAFDGELCAYVRTNYPILPLTTRLVESRDYPSRCDAIELGLGEWRYRARSVTAPLLPGEVVLLSDTNGDGWADECDYQLALDRSLPAPDPRYGSSIWYKIFCGAGGEVDTSFAECHEVIRRVHKVSGGTPQVAYLVGWQYEGHDSGYPALDRLNPRLGSREELLSLIREAKERYACTVSVHAKIDDSYPAHLQWDESVIGRDVDGSPMRWEVFNGVQAYHITHTKDVESGCVFRRLARALDLMPLEHTIHPDAFRSTSFSWEPDGFIGEAEELYCGMM